jgi:hypothetical protein
MENYPTTEGAKNLKLKFGNDDARMVIVLPEMGLTGQFPNYSSRRST